MPQLRRIVEFVDTSILRELLRVAMRAQRPAKIVAELRQRVGSGRVRIWSADNLLDSFASV